MTKRQAHSSKVFVLGIDGMDPRFSKRMLDKGCMPNLKKLIELGSTREDLKMIGGLPTITPPMWTSLSTGANPSTHGITCFWGQSHDSLDTLVYNYDSRRCKAEQLWNVTAEAGLKTLVWHWPGCSWPPTSDSHNLHVVDGVGPSWVAGTASEVDSFLDVFGSKDFEKTVVKLKDEAQNTGAGCVIHLDGVEVDDGGGMNVSTAIGGSTLVNIELKLSDGEGAIEELENDKVYSAIVEAHGWEKDLPKNTLEMTIYVYRGKLRRFLLLVPNEEGKYDRVEMYRSKKDLNPIGIATKEQGAIAVLDEYRWDETVFKNTRSFYIHELAEDGSAATICFTDAIDCVGAESVFSPHDLYKEVVDDVGYIPGLYSNCNLELVEYASIESWKNYANWQAESILSLIKRNNYKVIFSHFHNPDATGHAAWPYAKKKKRNNFSEELVENIMENVYIQNVDFYIGKLLPLLDEGWTILLVSDHGLSAVEAETCTLLGDGFGVNAKIMAELGYTVLKKNEKGKYIREIDWSKTTAIAPRGNHIWINLKGRDANGIVDPKDKYELEDKIISDLYNYRNEDGERIISHAVRNKDAEVFGMNGEECGDIIYFVHEKYCRVHGDIWSTAQGCKDTSVSPIFVAAGKGVKKNYKTSRAFHTIDVAPTVAALLGVRMPEQCEGAIISQIFEEEF